MAVSEATGEHADKRYDRAQRRPDMKVLVTGHAGYIGSVLVEHLLSSGHQVTGLDSFLYEGCDFLPVRASIEERRIDIRDVAPVDFEGFDAVVHLAALSNDPLGALDPQLTRAINLEGSIRLARAAREAGVSRFVFASSCSMYGASSGDDILDEGAPLRPLTAYAESKVRAEEALAGLADPDFCVVLMRNATVYGLSPRLRLDVVLNNLTAWAVTTGAIRLLSDGRSWRPLIHVTDLARVTEALLLVPADEISARSLNVGSNGQNYRIRDLAAIVSEVAGVPVELAKGAESDPRSYRVDFGRLARLLPDLEFEWDASRGARELVDAFVTEGLTREMFDGPAFFRLRRLRELLASARLGSDLRPARPSIAAR